MEAIRLLRWLLGVSLCALVVSCSPSIRTAGSASAPGELSNESETENRSGNGAEKEVAPPPPRPLTDFPATRRKCFRVQSGPHYCAETRPDLANFTLTLSADVMARPEELVLLKHMLLSAAGTSVQQRSGSLCQGSLLCLHAQRATLAQTLAAVRKAFDSQLQGPFYSARIRAMEELTLLMEEPHFKLASAASALQSGSIQLEPIAARSNDSWLRLLHTKTGISGLNRLTFSRMLDLKKLILEKATLKVFGPASIRRLSEGFPPDKSERNAKAGTQAPAQSATPRSIALPTIDLPGASDWSHGILSVAPSDSRYFNETRIMLQIALARWNTKHLRDVHMKLQPKTGFIRIAAAVVSGPNERVHRVLKELDHEVKMLGSSSHQLSSEELLRAQKALGWSKNPSADHRVFRKVLRDARMRVSLVWGNLSGSSTDPRK